MSHHEKPTEKFGFASSSLSDDLKLDDVFEQYKSEILGVVYFLYGASESAATLAYEKLRERCSRNYANSKISDLHAWVFRVLYNLAYEAVGNVKPRRHKNASGSSPELDGLSSNEEATARARRKFLQEVFLDFPFHERAVFLLRQNGGLSYEQIARVTGRSLAEVKTLMKDALFKLVDALERFSILASEKKREIAASDAEEDSE